MLPHQEHAHHSESFPSPEILEQLMALPQPNTQLTDLSGKTPAEIALLSQESRITIVLSGGVSPEERDTLQQASALPEADITIFEGEEVKQQETATMRGIVTEFLGSSTGQEAFSRFLEEMAQKPELVATEYQKYLLGHGQTGSITDPLKCHYLANLGLAQPDALRDQLVAFANQAIPEAQELFDSVVPADSPHPNLDRDQTQLVLMLATLSNFLRGGVFYGFRAGQNMSYEPRRIAYQCLNVL